MRVDEFGFALHNGDLRIIEKHTDAVAELCHHGVFALYGFRIVNFHAADAHAKRFSIVKQVEHFGIAAQCLGGNTATVEAGAAKLASLNDSHIQPTMSSFGSHFIATRTSTNDENVIFHWKRDIICRS